MEIFFDPENSAMGGPSKATALGLAERETIKDERSCWEVQEGS